MALNMDIWSWIWIAERAMKLTLRQKGLGETYKNIITDCLTNIATAQSNNDIMAAAEEVERYYLLYH